MNNSEWYKLIKNNASLDLTDFFSIPYQEILREIQENDILKNVINTRPREEYKNISTIGVGEHPGGGGYIGPRGWKAISLYNSTGDSKEIIIKNFFSSHQADEFIKTYHHIKKHRWTELSSNLTTVKEWSRVALEPYLYIGFIRILVLEPGGIIPPHDDIPSEVRKYQYEYPIASYNILNTFNFCLDQVAGNVFCHDNKILPFSNGKCFWLNVGKEHWTINMSSKIRVHLQVTGLYKKHFRKTIVDYVNAYNATPCMVQNTDEVHIENRN